MKQSSISVKLSQVAGEFSVHETTHGERLLPGLWKVYEPESSKKVSQLSRPFGTRSTPPNI
jgi:hypothetical protein